MKNNALNQILGRIIRWSFPEYANLQTGLELWRIRILFAIASCGTILGLPALIPSLWLALREGEVGVAAMDTLFYLLVLFVFLARHVAWSIRAGVALGGVFILGFGLMILLGPYGAGYVWVFSFPVLCGILLGMRPAVAALFLNALAVAVISWLVVQGLLPWANGIENVLEKWLVTAASLLVLNALVAISTSLILAGLKSTIDQLTDEIEVRRQTEAALIRSEELARSLIEYSAVPSVVFGTDGSIELVNRAFSDTFGWTIQDLEASGDWFAALYPDSKEGIKCSGRSWGDPNSANRILRIETGLTCLDRTGREVVIHSNILPDGRCHQQIVDHSDRNRAERERKLLEDQLRQAQKMEAIGNLAGGISHDFNNILSVILGVSQMILMELKPDHPLRAQIQEIAQAGNKAAALTRQLLAFSRRQVVQPVVLDLNEVLDEVRNMLVRLIKEDICLELNLDPELWNIEADPGQIDQVIINLAANARDAMPQGGVVTVSTRNIDLTAEYFSDRTQEGRPGAFVQLTVQDTGLGMDRDTVSRIFEPFFTTKGRHQGTGLGLATVYGIVKKAGGFIWVYSEPGLGTSFKIFFPRVEKQGEAGPRTPKRIDHIHGSETVLLIEDDPSVRRVVTAALSRFGYRVLETSGGAEAVELASHADHGIDLILTDVIMPGLSGKEAALEILDSRPGVKVLYMSGYVDETLTTKGILDKGTHLIEKPFTPEALAAKVREVLDG